MSGIKVVGVGLAGVAALLLAVACGDNAADGGTTTRSSGGPTQNDAKVAVTATALPCDVDNVLKTRCQTCHSSNPQYGASVPLVTWDDLQKPGPGSSSNKKVYELVKERIRDEARPMPPAQQGKLSDAELASIDTWVSSGAQSSSASCSGGGTVVEAVKPLPCTPDTTLKPSKPFTLNGGAVDQYMCFGVDVEVAKKRHVTALAPLVDNKDIVHHILLFQTEKAESSEPFPCAAFGAAAWRLVAGWAPGADNVVLPEAAGFPEEVGKTHWVLQLHYNTSKVQTGTDSSGYELCTTDQLRPNDAGIIGLGSTNFTIPARSKHTIRCDYRLGADFKDVTFFNAWPHMHVLGNAMSTEHIAGGKDAPKRILDQKKFEFESQLNFPIDQRVTTGDVMRTRCTWKNTTDATVKFGEGTGNEMCFDIVSYYPAIPDRVIGNLPIFTWSTPATSAQCQDEEE